MKILNGEDYEHVAVSKFKLSKEKYLLEIENLRPAFLE
jgi:hypothetical protein